MSQPDKARPVDDSAKSDAGSTVRDTPKETQKTETGSSSEKTGLKLSEETDVAISKTAAVTDVTLNAEQNLQAPASVELSEQLRKLFGSVDSAIQDSRLVQDVQRQLGQLPGRKFLEGSDTDGAAAANGSAKIEKFKGFTTADTPHGEATTKVYESGTVVTKFADGTELRFPPDGGAVEKSTNGKNAKTISRAEANETLATVDGDGFKARQNADGTLKIDFTKAQSDGATSMTLHPPGADGLKWTRTIPAQDGVPEQTVSAFADGRKQLDFAQPMSGVEKAVSTSAGKILVPKDENGATTNGGAAVEAKPDDKAELAKPKEESESAKPEDKVAVKPVKVEVPKLTLDVDPTVTGRLELKGGAEEGRLRFSSTSRASRHGALSDRTTSEARSDRRGPLDLRLPGSEREPSIPERMSTVVPFLVNPDSVFTPGVTTPFGTGIGDQFNPFTQLLPRERPTNPFDLTPRLGETPKEAPPWLAAAEAVRDLSQAKDVVEATKALDRLAELAQKGDQHAQTALAATILALTAGDAGLQQVQKMGLRGNPIFAPDLSHLSAQDKSWLKTSAMSKFTSDLGLYQLSGAGDRREAGVASQFIVPVAGLERTPLTTEAVAMLATAFTAASNTGQTREADQLAGVLRGYAKTDAGIGALWNVVHTEGTDQNQDLQRLLLGGIGDDSRGQLYMDSIVRHAVQDGRRQDIDLLAQAVTSPTTTPENSERAMAALRRAAENGHGDAVYDALTKSQGKNGDQHKLLETLGAIAGDGSLKDNQVDNVMNLLRDGIKSGDQKTHDSAMQGFLRASDHWSESDMQILSDNMSPAVAERLKDVVEKMEPAQAKKLAEILQDKLQNNSYSDVKQVTGAVTALGALSDFTGPDAAKIIKDAARTDRFPDANANEELTLAAVRSLMRMGGSQSEGSESALALLQEPGWKSAPGLNMDNAEFRKELADFVTGAKSGAEISEDAKKVAYNTGFPQSVASLFRDTGVSADAVKEFSDKARSHYSDATIRDALSRTALYNALPPQLRAEVSKPAGAGQEAAAGAPASDGSTPQTGPGEINPLQVIGQLANGNLEDSNNSILLTPLEQTVKDLRDKTAREARAVESQYSINTNLSQQSLEQLVDLTSKGVAAFDYFSSVFGSETLDNFIKEERLRLDNWLLSTDTRRETGQDLQGKRAKEQALSIALQTFDYQKMRESGDERQADLLALQMFKQHGAALETMSPQVWKDLGMTSQGAEGSIQSADSPRETVWQRLHRAGLAESAEPPKIEIGTANGLQQGLAELQRHRDGDKADTAARRALAFQGIDTDPALMQFTQVAMDLQNRMPDLHRLVSAGLAGSRTEDYSNKVRELVGSLETTYKQMNTPDAKTGRTPLQDAARSVEQMKQALETADPSVRQQLSQRIDAMEKMLSFFDPKSQQGMNMQLMFDHVNSNDFDASGFGQWLAGDGVKALGMIAGAVGAAALVTFSFGTATPILIAAAAAAGVGGIIGGEVTAEVMYGLGTGERTGSQLGHLLRDGLVDGADGQAQHLTGSQVFTDYAKQFGYGFAISLATMGVGAVFGKALQALGGSGAQAGMSANAGGFGRLAARLQQVEQAAEKVGGKQLAANWMKEFAHEFAEELTEEALQQGAEVVMNKILGDVNPVLGVVASAIIANRKMGGGFDLHPKPGDPHNVSLDIAEGTDVAQTMRSLETQLKADGMLVEWSGNIDEPMRIRTPEGGTIEVARGVQDGIQTGLPNPRVFDSTNGDTTNLDTTGHKIENPTDGIWDPTDYAVKVQQKMQEWSEAMAAGDFERALQIAESGSLEPKNRDREGGMSGVPVGTDGVRVDIDYAALSDVNSPEFRMVLSELNSPGNESSRASHGRTQVDIDPRTGTVDTHREYSVRMADPVIKVPAGTEVVVDGKTVKLDKPVEIKLFGSGENLDPVSKALLTQIKESPAGQRMIAQQAMIAMEERLVHLSQYENRNKLISPTLAQFLYETTDLGQTNPRQQGASALLELIPSTEELPTNIAEMEVVGLLYDSGFSVDDIQTMMGKQHYEMRKPLYDWLRAQEAKKS